MASSSAASVPGPPSSTVAAAPCAGCKFLRRKCQPECVFAPYFPPDNQQRFAHVHRVFGASNVAKLLLELHPFQREDAVNSLAYEAEMRMRDPVYGCVGVISLLHHQLRQLQADLAVARADLASYHSAAIANFANFSAGSGGGGYGLVNTRSGGLGFGRDQQMEVHGYDHNISARLGVNVTYDVGINVAGVNTPGAGVGQVGGQFFKLGAAGGDERQGIRPL